jgi:protein phosphatase
VEARDLIFAMLSDRGRVRRSNEDACAASPLTGAFVVCDGMGGAAGGEVASHLAVETFLSHISGNESSNGSGSRIQTRINAAIQAANRAVFQQAEKNPQLSGMGTTLVGLLHTPSQSEDKNLPELWLVHVGDSRCYLWRRGALKRMTEDHSLVEEQVRAGQITAAQAIESPMRNLITRAVGSQSTVEPEIHSYYPEPGDVYLLASDGLTRELTEDDLAAVLEQVPADLTESILYEACRSLIQAANAKGGGDNITVLLVAPNPV